MKKKFIKQWLIIMVGFIVVAMVALIGGASQVQTKYNKQVVNEALESKNFDAWFSLQTMMYKHIITQKDDTEHYQYSVYATIEAREENKYEERLYLVIMPLKDVKYAETNKDDNDQTQIKISTDDKVLLDTKEKYKEVSLSYGLNSSKLGFIYDGIDLEDYQSLNIYVSDYENKSYTFEIKDELSKLVTQYDREKTETYANELGYQKGLTSKDLSDKLQPEITKLIIIYSSVYLGLIILGYIAFYTFKIIKVKREEKKRNFKKHDRNH